MNDVPAWATALIAVGAALVGLVGRAGFEEWRDFRGARRVVVSELGLNELALRAAKREKDSGVPLANQLVVEGYREVQLVLARYLPDQLWAELESVYSRLGPIRTTPATAFASESEGDRLLADLDAVSAKLRAYRFVRGLIGRGVPKNA
ncbi:MAG: hypothetical protein M3024_00185 [Candidatus Dormibacteraeota bacterium]|nr:hypothetical protein [Candidatus Dormibacteraeota bacterium]